MHWIKWPLILNEKVKEDWGLGAWTLLILDCCTNGSGDSLMNRLLYGFKLLSLCMEKVVAIMVCALALTVGFGPRLSGPSTVFMTKMWLLRLLCDVF